MKDRGVTILWAHICLKWYKSYGIRWYIDHGKVIELRNDGTQNQNIEDLFFSLTDKEDEKESEE